MKRTELKRRTPLKAAHKPKKKPTRTTLSNKADRLFSLQVRARGRCEAAGLDNVKCSGNHQCCHIFGRRYRAIRWDERNALCMCQAHHYWYTSRPELWSLLIMKHWPGRWEELAEMIQTPWDRDLDAVLERLGA